MAQICLCRISSLVVDLSLSLCSIGSGDGRVLMAGDQAGEDM